MGFSQELLEAMLLVSRWSQVPAGGLAQTDTQAPTCSMGSAGRSRSGRAVFQKGWLHSSCMQQRPAVRKAAFPSALTLDLGARQEVF